MMTEPPAPDDFGLDWTDLELDQMDLELNQTDLELDQADLENNLAEFTPAMWDELEALFAEPSQSVNAEIFTLAGDVPTTPVVTQPEPPPAETLFGWPEVPPPSPPRREFTLPPRISPQGLWAEIGHLFQTPAFSQPEGIVPAAPLMAAEIDALSQAMLANDGGSIQTLVHQIQQNYSDPESIEIFLAATRNLCC